MRCAGIGGTRQDNQAPPAVSQGIAASLNTLKAQQAHAHTSSSVSSTGSNSNNKATPFKGRWEKSTQIESGGAHLHSWK